MAAPVYAIVGFLKSRTVAIVPVSWLSVEEDKSFWPPKCSKAYSKVMTLVRDLKAPEKDWDEFHVRIFGKAGNINF